MEEKGERCMRMKEKGRRIRGRRVAKKEKRTLPPPFP
jgi:hypothetical protein